MIYYKELALVVMEAEKSQDCGWQAEDPGEPMVQFQPDSKDLRTKRRMVQVSFHVQAQSQEKTNIPA